MYVRSARLLLVGALLAAGCGSAEPPAIDTEGSYLDDEERLRLFDLERSDYLLGRALGRFHGAVRDGDRDALAAEIAPDFRARVVRLPPTLAIQDDGRTVRAERLAEPLEVDAAGFADWVDELGERFERIATVSFARYRNSAEIIDGIKARARSDGSFRVAGTAVGGGPLEVAGQFHMLHAGFERLQEGEDMETSDVSRSHWIHALELEAVEAVASAAPLFEEVTERCGIDVTPLYDNWRDRDKGVLIFTGGVCLGDVNRDGHLDLFVPEMLRSWLYFGDGKGGFRDSGWAPLAPSLKHRDGRVQPFEPFGALFDANGNGKLDVLHAGKLYTWSEKRSEMVAVRNTTPLPNADATLCDYDRDGMVDLYFVNSGPYAPKERRNENVWFDDERTNGRANQLFRNLGGGKFEDVTAATGASPSFGRTFATTWFYADDDDWPDLFGANEFGRNDFIVGNGDGTFREVPDVDPVFGGFSMGVVSGDVDGDQRADLYVSNMYSKAGQRVYAHLDLSIYPESAQKMFMASVTGNRLYRALGDLAFENTSAYAGGYAVGWGFSGAMLDVDLDGWLDLYAPCGYISVDRSKPDG